MLKSDETYSNFFSFYFAEEECGKFMLRAEKFSLSIWNLEITEKYRGMGLGTQMMMEIVEMLKERYSENTRVYLLVRSANIPAKKIYEKAGFRSVPEEKFGNLEEMELWL